MKTRAEKRVEIGCVIFESCGEAAETLGVSRSMISTMIKRGEARLIGDSWIREHVTIVAQFRAIIRSIVL